MTDLSHAARAVLDAFSASEGGIWLEGDPERLAAALRAVAAQADYIGDRLCVPAHNILAIATELENIND
jgi:hypothetical protein